MITHLVHAVERLRPVFENCFLFLEIRRTKNNEEHVWFFFFSFVMKKHRKHRNTKFREQLFSESNKMVFSVFLKTVLKNSF